MFQGLHSDGEEAAFVIDASVKTAMNDGVPLDEIAILYRSNAQSRVRARPVQRPHSFIACMGACASSSAPRSNTQWRTCD